MRARHLSTETVQSAALSLESVDDIERGDCLPLGVLCVGDRVTDDTFEEGLEDTTGLFVDHLIDVLVRCFLVTCSDGEERTYWLRYA